MSSLLPLGFSEYFIFMKFKIICYHITYIYRLLLKCLKDSVFISVQRMFRNLSSCCTDETPEAFILPFCNVNSSILFSKLFKQLPYFPICWGFQRKQWNQVENIGVTSLNHPKFLFHYSPAIQGEKVSNTH